MSGIYIKDISMPTGCETCYFHRWVDIGVGTCAGCELLKELMNDDRDRLPNCPLIPVPDHGDLIDRDALNYIADDSAITAFDYVTRSQINGAPTVVPADKEEKK